MSALTKYAGGAALSVQHLKGALQSSINETGRLGKTGDVEYLQFREGYWQYGKEGFEPDPEGLWIIAVPSLFHGYICWHQKQVEWKKAVPLMQSISTIVVPSDLKGKDGAQLIRGFTLACMHGDDAGVTAEFSTNSRGGLEMVEKLVDAITAQIDVDPDMIWPVVKLSSSSYQHKEYGLTHKPELEITGWMTAEEALRETHADEDEPEAQETAPTKPAATKTVTRRTKAAETQPEPEPEPESPPSRRRRRAA